LGRAFAKPAVIGQVDEKIGVRLDIFTGEMRKSVFVANQHRSFHLQSIKLERNRSLTASEAALDGSEPFEQRQDMFKRNVFAENDKGPLTITAHNSALGIDQKAAVIKIDVFDRLCVGPPWLH